MTGPTDQTLPDMIAAAEQRGRQSAEVFETSRTDLEASLRRVIRERDSLAESAARASSQELRIYHLENTLRWIRMQAGLHYLGGAFEPEHMRSLCNLAADALHPEGRVKPLPDFEEAMAKAQEAAREWADQMSLMIEDEEEVP